MAVILSIFNNKGGVGKTTYLYHIAHLLEKRGLTVLMVDCDSQCNLTAYSLDENAISKAWAQQGNSIYRIIENVEKGMGDFRQRQPHKIKEKLWIVPGDLFLSNYEDKLGDSWNRAKGGSESDLRIQSAIYRYIKWASAKVEADIVLIDLGPNLGALNRTVLSGSDFFIVPISPDLFSIRGTENLGNKLELWRSEWTQCCRDNKAEIDIPKGAPKFLGYVMQQHNIRNNSKGMTQGWRIFGDQVREAINENIVDKLNPLDQVVYTVDEDFQVGSIPNLHSLIPYSLNARKPVFECGSREGLKGAHITSARNSVDHFSGAVDKIQSVILVKA